MGRGRAKAKQTKVARELKYSTGSLDPDRLKAELAGAPRDAAGSRSRTTTTSTTLRAGRRRDER